MLDEIRLKEVYADDSELKKLTDLLSKVGAKVDIIGMDVENRSRVRISFDTAIVRRKTNREAGRKKVKTGLYYSIAEIRARVKEEGLEKVLSDLNISESTYYRRMRYYREHKVEETELFD